VITAGLATESSGKEDVKQEDPIHAFQTRIDLGSMNDIIQNLRHYPI
jgi:hypothetical protein